MPRTQQFTITLPDAMADALRAKVASDEYACECAVIEAALKSMFAWEQELEEWLATDVVAAAEELAADPSTALSIEQVRATIQAEMGRALAPEKTQSVSGPHRSDR